MTTKRCNQTDYQGGQGLHTNAVSPSAAPRRLIVKRER